VAGCCAHWDRHRHHVPRSSRASHRSYRDRYGRRVWCPRLEIPNDYLARHRCGCATRRHVAVPCSNRAALPRRHCQCSVRCLARSADAASLRRDRAGSASEHARFARLGVLLHRWGIRLARGAAIALGAWIVFCALILGRHYGCALAAWVAGADGCPDLSLPRLRGASASLSPLSSDCLGDADRLRQLASIAPLFGTRHSRARCLRSDSPLGALRSR